MQINLNVKIKAGPRTPVEVDVYRTSINERVIKFGNGKQISESDLATWIQGKLRFALQVVEEHKG